jgi:hypothetical protein
MTTPQSNVSVGADPARHAVIIRVHEDSGQRRWMDSPLTPTEAETVAKWLRDAAKHVRAGSGRELNVQRLHSLKCEVSVEAGTASSVTLAVSEPFDSGRHLLGVPLPAEMAEQVAGWLEAAALHMKVQASGELDLRTVFPRGPVGDA